MEKDNKAVGIGAVLLVAVIAAGIYFYKFASPAPVPVPPPPASALAVPVAAAPAETSPKLQESDDFVRGKAAGLSADATFASWLKTDDLIPRFAAAVNLVGQGRVPKDALSFLAPHKKFSVRKAGENVTIDPRSYARYDAVASGVGSIDVAAAAKLFQDAKPLFQEAYQGLGEKNGDVQEAVLRATAELLKTPVLKGRVALKEKGLVYAYADDALEGLSPAQKQLLRMGPKNVAKIQSKLREFSDALGAAPK